MTELKRSLSLPLVVLYGLGVTIGAGIYVLLAATAAEAGAYAPMSFVIAAVVMAFSAASFAELSARLPVSAGEAAYVREGLQSERLALITGLLVISSGVVSSAAITVGSTGYIREFLDVDANVLVVLILILITAIAAWGILESVTFASLFTLVEGGALLVLIGAGFASDPDLASRLPELVPELGDSAAWLAVSGASLLAFFAFIGFEDIVNLAEEVKEPRRTLPWAIFLTLLLATVIYFLVTAVAVLTVPLDALAQSEAPVSLVFRELTGISPTAITAVAIVATLNGVIIQLIMASRVVYGLASQGSLPEVFSRVHPVTRTPLVATLTVAAIVLVMAIGFPLESLAEWTSRIALTVFGLANLALTRIKLRDGSTEHGGIKLPIWVPVIGALSCAGLLLLDLLTLAAG